MLRRALVPVFLSSVLILLVLVVTGLLYWRSRKVAGRVEALPEPIVPMATYRNEYFLADYPTDWHCTTAETTFVFSEEADPEVKTAPVFRVELVPIDADSEPDLEAAIERVVLPTDTIKGKGKRGKHGYEVLLERYDPESQQTLAIYAVVKWNAFYSHLAYETGTAPQERFSEVYPIFRDMRSKLCYLPPWPEQPFSTVTVERDLYSFECPVEWVKEVVQRQDDSDIGEWWCILFSITRLGADDTIPDPTSPQAIQEFVLVYGGDRKSEILHQGPVVIDGREGYEYVAEFYQGGARRLYRRWSTVVKDEDTLDTFSITAMVPVSEWEEAEPIFRVMRDSFKFERGP